MSTETKLHWDIYGEGENLILIHGWGMNGAVWHQVVEELSQSFRVHVVDLPGYGHSHQVHSQSIADIADSVLQDAPEKAIWLGWSLGGLIATHVAMHQSERVIKLVTLASSPRFSAEGRTWRGIAPSVLNDFTLQLTEDFQGTIERFMALQAMGSPSARQDVKQLKSAVLSRPMPNPNALHLGLELLATIDYREYLNTLTMPIYRLYGRLDGLVPVKVASVLDKKLETSSHIFKASSHAPFMSEKQAFCDLIKQL
ncbi:pimeloyl-ACP methyl ester esterase BioH [Vibrio breoganii]|uniref:pimeloyl-ACP methyl ester esterase BioH n=1 Tax=Vibrio breoganii TaxID=553239 RepID=UPI000C85C15C|nr:pimeloyl-ACP methyl ester esterase BioH [Vibrio breoganii]PMO79222.1 pimeloyl-[acyl-carrier protein] methyl ester esterase [Vibrio breoganii]PMO86769.1 pimeloyl-[acyl-carrier protein] methyl ester esterase [Vibrio breoganii]